MKHPVLEDLTLQLQPNPAHDQLQLSLSSPLQQATVEVYDMNGRNVLSRSFTGQALTIDVHELQRGAYALRLIHGGEMLVKQFMLQ